MVRSRAIPVLIKNGTRCLLEPAPLGNGLHDEAWLQALIHDHPQILPVTDIEPAFGDLIAAAREVPIATGFVDNLFLTASGDIVLVEVKLWRNPDMRRKVVAQTLDYIAALASMSYDAFEQAVSRGQGAPRRLYDLVRDHPEALEEAAFVDAVALNLRRGRLLAVVVGDGIRSETEALAALLQSHAGAHFTFALVELATWRSGTGDILAVPSTLAKTVMIERGIVRIEEGIATMHPVPCGAETRPQSLSLEDFWAALAMRDPSWPAAIRAFLIALEPLGVYPDLKASLNLKVDLPDRDKPVNLAYIDKQGKVWPNPMAWSLPERIWKPYFQTLADLVGGIVIDEPNTKQVAVEGRSAPRIGALLPQHHDAWVAAIERVLRTLQAKAA